MTRKHLLLLAACVLFISLSYVGVTTKAEKGRQYYEETGQVVWDIQTEEKIIALTFDDGPHPKFTAQVLDILAEHEAKGTFFIVGQNAKKTPEIVLRAHRDGHEIANHTYTHSSKISVTELKEELKQTNELIYSITNYQPVLFRPVGGQYTDEMIKAASDNGYQVVMWSWHQDTEDWKNPGVKKIVNKVLKGTRPGDIILFHDGGGKRDQTIDALKEILPVLKKQGYKFVTVSELVEYKNQKYN
ncbi:polysaccharide deacetylase family protein [Lysinibacillus sp. 54212]|uniref:polysaccharide deacetylase family protein n=1 Tax=Lysinibacillus sp. 54212 TaxID=3119829 RepID=UPI002FCA75CD